MLANSQEEYNHPEYPIVMARYFSAFNFAVAALVLATFTGLIAAACFPGTPTTTPGAPLSPESPTAAASGTVPSPSPSVSPTFLPPAAPVKPSPAGVPTATPVVTPQVEVPSATSGSEAMTGARPANADSPVFYDLALLEERAFSYLSELAVDVGVRTSGSDLEEQAAWFLLGRLEELGYSSQVQDFTWSTLAVALSISSPELETLEANIVQGSSLGEARGELVFVGLARPGDLPAGGLEGQVALIERGEITFGIKVAEVYNAGAVGAVIHNNERGNFRGTLGAPAQIPAVALTRADGQHIRELLDRGETVEATVAVENTDVLSHNVITQLPGRGKGVVVIGAHYDTVPDSIGASDNSSGMGVLMAVAEQVSGRSFPFTVRFIAFGSEETGLHGSEYYVGNLSAEELQNVHLMINLDSVGSGSYLRLLGSPWAANHVKETADREGISLDMSRNFRRGSSDHANFRDAGVPFLFFYADDLSRINSPADSMEHINSSLLGDATALVLDLLENVDRLPGYGE